MAVASVVHTPGVALTLAKKPLPGTEFFGGDVYLEPWAEEAHRRYMYWRALLQRIEEHEGSLEKFASSYQHFGLNTLDNGTVRFHEWLPSARAVWLTGDFNGWDRQLHQCQRDQYGCFSLTLPPRPDGTPQIPHGSRIKIAVQIADGSIVDRIPAWIHRVQQEQGQVQFNGVYWHPPHKYVWQHPQPQRVRAPRIYEAHVGMATHELRIGTYTEFRDSLLPYIHSLGYTHIQLMGIMEHAYYASFGYQVTSFFAPSSRYGTPEELKSLIDTAHGMGIGILLDVVHSHASKNVLDGINQLDGSDHHYFHAPPRGEHPLWDSRLFNYGHWEVLRFLLSNCRYWLEEYRFDGFRFDGVTSMLYTHHGIAHAFVDGYGEYFGDARVDIDAYTYLTLANLLTHRTNPHALSIAEDVSGMPGTCRATEEGGLGFDFRLAMAIPDKWIKCLKELTDEQWDMADIVHTLINRRHGEPCIAYAESHDQALVGDKTLAFWLMDKEMYTHMSVATPLTPIIDRGLALHKMIRLITCALGGEGYLTFMGNEFGHPEWIDFPRAGNNNSYHYARRQWPLVHDNLLRYRPLMLFDQAMMHAEEQLHWLPAQQGYVSVKHEGDKVIAFDRGPAVFVFNFHPSNSYTGYRIPVPVAGVFRHFLDTDCDKFAGHNRLAAASEYPSIFVGECGCGEWRQNAIRVYIPARTALVIEFPKIPVAAAPTTTTTTTVTTITSTAVSE